MAHDLHFSTRTAKVRAAASGAADVNRPSNAFLHWGSSACTDARGPNRLGLEDLFGAEFFANLGANTRQIAARGLHIALAKRQLPTDAGMVAQGHAAMARVQADDVSHQHVAAEIAGLAHSRAVAARGRIGQADQGIAHRLQGFLRSLQGNR